MLVWKRAPMMRFCFWAQFAVVVGVVELQAEEMGRVETLPGFRVELLYRVPKEQQGSWVALAKDPQGRLIVSDEEKAGLFRIAILDGKANGVAPQVRVEKIPVDASGAQGLTWAFDSLYAHISGGPLLRIRDMDGDDVLETVETLPGATGGGEHGNHAVIPTADGQALYVLAGNHTRLPELTGSRLTSWKEDLLLPRLWDANGHARGVLAPGGWVCQLDPRKQTYELFCSGFRNAYDITLTEDGEMFTFDADMEWDMGTAWYRPTRICHLVSGGEYGWRSGSGKWPTYYEDSLPPVVDVGPGSPTGMTSGKGSRFPDKYRRALFALDWTFGTIYAVHLEAHGASYAGRIEPFVWGAPLPVTDALVGDDGALYFTVGGRGAQSALYRATWTGDAGETAADSNSDRNSAANVRNLVLASEARATRRRLERHHGRRNSQAVAEAWPYLGHADRFLRYAARLAVEAQPVEQWSNRVYSEPDAQARITAGVGLARMGGPEHREPLLAALLELESRTLSESQRLGLLRAYALTLMRLGLPTDAERQRLIGVLDRRLPSPSADENDELVRLLAALRAPSVAAKGMALIRARGEERLPDWSSVIERNPNYGGVIARMFETRPPARAIGTALMLSNVRQGWTLDDRRDFFEFLNSAAQASGGASYPGFLEAIRGDALGNCSNEERAALADLTGESFRPTPDFPIEPIVGPGRAWTAEEILSVTGDDALGKASFERGRSLFFAADCGKCHRFAGLGGGVGPDLTSVRNKFDARYLVDALVEPSKFVSDQYASSQVSLASGKTLNGLVVEEGDSIVVYTPDAQAEPITVARSDVEAISPSKISQMPTGLLDRLNGDEVRDLVAYVLSSGIKRRD